MNESGAGLVDPPLVKVEATPRPSPPCSPRSPSLLLPPSDVFERYYFTPAADSTPSSSAVSVVPAVATSLGVSSSLLAASFTSDAILTAKSTDAFVQRGACGGRDSSVSVASPSPAPSPSSPGPVDLEDETASRHYDRGLVVTPVSSTLSHNLASGICETSQFYSGNIHGQLSDSTHSLPSDFLSSSSSPFSSSSTPSSFAFHTSCSCPSPSSSHTQAYSCPLPASSLLDYNVPQHHHHKHHPQHDSRKHKTHNSEPYQRQRQHARHGASPRSSSSPSLSSTSPSPSPSSSSPPPPEPESPLTPPPTPPTEVGGVHGAGYSSPCQRTFREAVSRGNTAELRRILEEREDKVNVNLLDVEGQTALHHSCLQGNLELVKILVRFGADVKLANKDGWAPLHLAVYNGHSDIMLFLLSVQQQQQARSEADDRLNNR